MPAREQPAHQAEPGDAQRINDLREFETTYRTFLRGHLMRLMSELNGGTGMLDGDQRHGVEEARRFLERWDRDYGPLDAAGRLNRLELALAEHVRSLLAIVDKIAPGDVTRTPAPEPKQGEVNCTAARTERRDGTDLTGPYQGRGRRTGFSLSPRAAWDEAEHG